MTVAAFYYCDFHFNGVEEYSYKVPMNEAFNWIHKCAKVQARNIALVFPKLKGSQIGNTLRIFTISESNLADFKRAAFNDVVFRDYSEASNILCTKVDDVKSWVAFSRFRIPTKKSDRNDSGLHDRRKLEAQELPFFYVNSTSTQQSYMLRVKMQKAQSVDLDFQPNSYGLGSMANPLWLPDV